MKNDSRKYSVLLIFVLCLITVISIIILFQPKPKTQSIDISSLQNTETVYVSFPEKDAPAISSVQTIVDEKPYDIPMDLYMQWFVQDISTEYNIDEKLVFAIIEKESAYDEDAKCGKCVGLMQVSTKWHKERMEKLGFDNMTKPQANVHIGVDYLAELFDKYHDENRVLMAYNMGESGAKKYWDKDIYSTKYVKEVQQIKRNIKEYGEQ